MASEKWLNLFDSLQGGALGGGPSTANIPAGVILYDKEKHVVTGFRVVDKDSPEVAPRNERTGRWDAATGQIVWDDDKATEQSAVIGPAERKRPLRSKPGTSKPPQAAKPPKPPKAAKPFVRTEGKLKGTPGRQIDPATDPRKDEILRLRAQGKPIYDISRAVHMNDRGVAKVIRYWLGRSNDLRLDPVNKAGERNGNAKHTAEIVLKVAAATGTYTQISERLGVSYSQVRKIKRGQQWSHLTGIEPKTTRAETAAD